MKVAFGTVIYPNAMKYAEEFVNSLNSQTFTQFEALIINDHVEKTLVDESFGSLKTKNTIIEYDRQFTPVELRVMLLLEAMQRDYDVLIIGDFDDCFSEDRVEKVLQTVWENDSYSFFYNEITAFDGRHVMPALPTTTDSINCILDYNYLGLSNTAIRLKALDTDFIRSLSEFKDSIFDWYLFSRILLENRTGLFVPDAVSFYRFHEDNLVGEISNNSKKIEYEIQVKKTHYRYLRARSPILLNRYNDYIIGNYSYTGEDTLHYWWGYTIGGTNK